MLYLVATLVSLSQTNAYADKPLAAIDIGHCVTRPGASSARGLPEYGFNVKVAEALNEALLGTDQWSTLLIKADNCLTLTERPAAANNQNATFLCPYITIPSFRNIYLPGSFMAISAFFVINSRGIPFITLR